MPRVSDEERAKYLAELRAVVERLCREHKSSVPPATVIKDFDADSNPSEKRRIQRGMEAAARAGLLHAHAGNVYSPAVDKGGKRLVWVLVTVPD